MKIFIINLERSGDRKALMSEKISQLAQNPLFAELGLEYEFFPAIDCKGEHFHIYRERLQPELCYMQRGRVITQSELACYASHYCLWERCVELDEPVIVLEDDVYFEEHFLSAIREIVEMDFGFVRLYYMDKKRERYVKPLVGGGVKIRTFSIRLKIQMVCRATTLRLKQQKPSSLTQDGIIPWIFTWSLSHFIR